MADYIYLLENRLSLSQQNALNTIREVARERGLTVFLVGGAVRDLTSGSPVRDLDVAVQGNALKLKKDLEKAGGVVVGEHDPGQALFVTFPGGAKVEIGSTLSVTYPKPGKPVVKAASILEDLRRRDFTANAMAISLNTGSYGLLMDPLNGVADIENRELRLVSNYGFIEDPIRMVRAVRLMARLGWQMNEKTQARYAIGKEEGYISAASAFQRGYELEEIVHEEDPLRVMRGLEAEGWMAILAPYWSAAKVNVPELERLRESQIQLQMQGIHPNPAAANFPLLTAKLSANEAAELKKSFARPGFVREVESLEAEAKEFAAQLSAKSAALPSQAWKLLHSARPEAVLQVAYSTKSPAIQAKFKSFYTEWPLARQKVPHTLLQEMRIVPDLYGYAGFIESLTFELMDGKLGTVEEMKAFAEPFSPPAPPPPVHLRRPRAAKKEAKAGKSRAKKAAVQAATGKDVDAVLALTPETVDTANEARETTKPAAVKAVLQRKTPEASVAPPALATTEPLPAKDKVAKGITRPKPFAVVAPPVLKAVAAKKPVPQKVAAKTVVPRKAVAANSTKKAPPPVKPTLRPLAKAAAKTTQKTSAKKATAKAVPVKSSGVKRPAKKTASKTAMRGSSKAGAKVAAKTAAKTAAKNSPSKPATRSAAKKRR